MVKKLQRRVRRKERAIADRVDEVKNLLDATRAEAERQAAGRVALQQSADEAQRDKLRKALAVWGWSGRRRQKR